ncbi:hypothetical protein Dshi_2638 [Dinoroseobacter shibae DFL 12 = DSM 16493]|jgi:hypothetical protein|uniref:Pilus assembly protein n=1 Tax=Dinoroseobacter shibae (strain DSM 16493 / NCIMB 14021 / DFL 12) TaxID=398580 RepID=A8LI37_DINSH|nr:hypothetical protein [Dinoroseobacter shibae]ABV94371.1 hypothetical protein Dshi_2638 [Dinoroseobacter shibae DFL 12 = DSM 16493]URF45801.1 pilus assembly protein [Dinoroseobacter shibae]URF50107.1 pilus assembly protein [Dinoroseobacter shibae]
MRYAQLEPFIRSEDGAVTVDWVVLTAALVGLAIAVAAVLGPSMTTNSGSLNRQLNTHQIHTDFNVPVPVD